jgi:CDP-glycerol glycerophosphotransferase
MGVEVTDATVEELIRSAARLIDGGELVVAGSLLRSSLKAHPKEPDLLFQQARLDSKSGRPNRAADGLERAIVLAPDRPEYYVDLVKTVPGDAIWQRIDVLERGAAAHAGDLRWVRDLAESYARAGEHEQAARQHGRLRGLGDDTPERAALEGLELDLAGKTNDSGDAYARAIDLDSKRARNLRAKELGVGVFFQRLGQWKDARREFLSHLDRVGPSPELLFRIGLCCDRAYRWREAEGYYRWAVWLNENVPVYWYKLGFALERQSRWLEASDCYRVCVAMPDNKDARYHAYRAGWCLHRACEFEAACHYYLRYPTPEQRESWGLADQSLPVPRPRTRYTSSVIEPGWDRLQEAPTQHTLLQPEHWTKRADQAMQDREFMAAADLYGRALDRSDSHDMELYYRRGYALFCAGCFKKAAGSFRLSRLFPNPDGMPMERYDASSPKGRDARYVELWETLPLREDVILYEASHGKQIGCHPLAIFEHIVDDPAFAHMTHVWAVEDEFVSIPSSFLNRENVVIATMHHDLYLRYLATAKYLVNNSTFYPYFVRRDGQRYLNTWHGTPLKSMGRRDKSSSMGHTNLARNLLHATHAIVPNEHTARMFLDDFDVRGLYEGAIALTGSPRIDRMVNKSAEEREEMRRSLVGNSERKIILYAPTWRGSLAAPGADVAAAAETLNVLERLDCEIVFRAHHFVEGTLASSTMGFHLVSRDIETYDLLSVVDVLVTDYSSVLFDFLPTGREIIRHMPDLETYEQERGFSLDLSILPGTPTRTLAELEQAATTALCRTHLPDSVYKEAAQMFAPMEDGHATERATRFFFHEDQTWTLPSDEPRTRVLFRASLIPNGMATSLQNLLQSLPSNDIRPVVILEQGAIESSPDRRGEMEQLPQHVQVLGRSGASLFSIEEHWIVQKFMSQGELLSDEQWVTLWRGFEREFRRLTGGLRFDASIEFDGYPLWWAALVSASPNAGRRAIYQHSQMLREYQTRFPHLRTMFELYKRRFDALIAVSEQLMERNKVELSEFGVGKELSRFSPNQLNVKRIQSMSNEAPDPDVESWLGDKDHVFVTIGRLSVEKDQEMLIRSFVEIGDAVPGSKLIIVGSGFLDSRLQHVVDELDVSDRVLLAGQRDNPFPILARADTFVLSSRHEGQPMVLLEALSLGVPIISTDLVGARELLGGDDPNGLLVSNNQHSLAEALLAGYRHEVPCRPFNADEYAESALQQFRSVALGQTNHGTAA